MSAEPQMRSKGGTQYCWGHKQRRNQGMVLAYRRFPDEATTPPKCGPCLSWHRRASFKQGAAVFGGLALPRSAHSFFFFALKRPCGNASGMRGNPALSYDFPLRHHQPLCATTITRVHDDAVFVARRGIASSTPVNFGSAGQLMRPSVGNGSILQPRPNQSECCAIEGAVWYER